MKKHFLALFITSTVNFLFAQSGDIPINPALMPMIVKIASPLATQTGRLVMGTGFIVSQMVTDKLDTARAYFLITAKHLMSDWTPVDSTIKVYNTFVDIAFYRKISQQAGGPKIKRLHLFDKYGNLKKFSIHPHNNPNVDVCAIYLDEDVLTDPDIIVSSFDISYLRQFDSITSLSFNLGSQVFALGYPFGITSLKNSYPIAKSGYIASIPGEEFSIQIADTNRSGQLITKKLQGKILIIDGLIVNGNSGGPIILPSLIKTRIDSTTKKLQHWTKASENQIIGIQSGKFGTSGLSYAFSSDYIVESINQLLNKRGWIPVEEAK